MERIRGIDFTSRPSRRKPITVAECELDGGTLRIERLRSLTCFLDFESALCNPGPWIAGIDFPFGQPRRLIDALIWPDTWMGYVAHVVGMEKVGFEDELARYIAERPDGDKEHKRIADPKDAASPMKLNRPAVAKMFFEGAPRIARSGASIVPCAPNESDRVVVEGYAALPVRALLEEKASYKGKTPNHTEARRRIVSSLSSERCRERYGLTVELNRTDRERLIDDATGDLLDAVLCALQAAWAARQGPPAYGVPDNCDPLEGWIVDPLR